MGEPLFLEQCLARGRGTGAPASSSSTPGSVTARSHRPPPAAPISGANDLSSRVHLFRQRHPHSPTSIPWLTNENRMQNAECRMQNARVHPTHHASRFTFHVSRFAPSLAPRPLPLAPRNAALPRRHPAACCRSSLSWWSPFLVVSRSQKGLRHHRDPTRPSPVWRPTWRSNARRPRSSPPCWPGPTQFNYGLQVSANYINRDGFDQTLAVPGPRSTRPT